METKKSPFLDRGLFDSMTWKQCAFAFFQRVDFVIIILDFCYQFLINYK